ncbi:class I histocompatibility antigen, F10 alpha chain-like isoform X2 [Excalfactoria chinensis]|uniref:class I histocompatibility antigen, F10 alpha chain-like isoform X2 n=1 Tax=Excalfactoria chinensis TaxID=46218 RepID=UPI003B3BB466
MTDPGPGLPWFVDVGYVDGEIFVHYDSTARRYVPRTEWMKAAGAVDPEYWDRNTRIAQSRSHTWQWMYGCDIFEDGTTRGYDQYGYDGRDFIALDKDTMTYTAAVPEAVPSKRAWEEGNEPERWKHYLEETCVQWLRRYVEHGKAELGRTEQPEVRVWGKEADGILTLSCRAHGFYPRPIAVSWVKDGAVLGQDTHSGGIVPNSDGTYHTWVTIEALPGDGDKYQCRVEHASLPQPGLYSWERPQSNVVPIVVGVVVAIVAIAIVAGVGFFIYRQHAGKKEKGYNVAPRFLFLVLEAGAHGSSSLTDQDGASSNSSTGSNPTI